MAEPLEQENEDPWAAGPESPEPWCDTGEGGHDDHAKFLAERAAAVAGWSASAEAMEEALGRSRYVVRTMRSEAADEAAGLYTQIGRLVRELRQVADAAAWRALQEAAQARDEQQATDMRADPPFACSSAALCGDQHRACGNVPGHAGRHYFGQARADGHGTERWEWDDNSPAVRVSSPDEPQAAPPRPGADELRDERAAAVGAIDAARDAREAWNDPDGGDSRDVQ